VDRALLASLISVGIACALTAAALWLAASTGARKPTRHDSSQQASGDRDQSGEATVKTGPSRPMSGP